MPWFSFHFADFAFSFLSILFEGVPFLVLGALISGAVDAFAPPELIARILPRNPVAAIFFTGLLGGVFPMCECGSVIVIRRFLAKGLPVSCAVTYMLAAPIVSPLVAFSTFAAFRGQSPWVMTAMRLLIGYGVAVLAGLIVQRLPVESVLQPSVIQSLPPRSDALASLPPLEGALGASPLRSGVRRRALTISAVGAPTQALEWAAPGFGSKLLRAARAATADFLDVALFFVIGSALAATFNTAVDQSVVQPLAANNAVAILAMMGFAGALALCSSTDAFIAASFVPFPFTAKLAFLLFGPVFDVKLFFLYSLVYKRSFVVALALGLFAVIAIVCMRMSALGI